MSTAYLHRPELAAAREDCQRRWQSLQDRGNPTAAEIDSIDKATPWSPVEPGWWLKMMAVRHRLRLAPN